MLLPASGPLSCALVFSLLLHCMDLLCSNFGCLFGSTCLPPALTLAHILINIRLLSVCGPQALTLVGSAFHPEHSYAGVRGPAA